MEYSDRTLLLIIVICLGMIALAASTQLDIEPENSEVDVNDEAREQVCEQLNQTVENQSVYYDNDQKICLSPKAVNTS